MHICLVSPTSILPTPSWGGVNSHTKMLARMLRGQGSRVTLLTSAMGRGAGETSVDGIRVVSMPLPGTALCPQWDRCLSDEALRIHREDRIDLVFSQGQYAQSLLAEADLRTVPFLSFAHNFSAVHFFNVWQEVDGPRSLFSYLLRTVPRLVRVMAGEARFWRRCRCVVSVSRRNADHLSRFYRVPPERLRVLHHWLPDGEFGPDPAARAERRMELGIAGEELVFLMLGSFWRPKGWHVALKAFHQVAARLPGSRLVAVGGGDDDGRIRAMPETRALGDRVVLTGVRPHAEMPSLLAAADVFVFPTLLAEGLSFALVEGVTSGLPVIATDRGGNPETVGDAGKLVPGGDEDALAAAMLELGRDPDLRRDLARRALLRGGALFSEKAGRANLREILLSLDLPGRAGTFGGPEGQ